MVYFSNCIHSKYLIPPKFVSNFTSQQRGIRKLLITINQNIYKNSINQKYCHSVPKLIVTINNKISNVIYLPNIANGISGIDTFNIAFNSNGVGRDVIKISTATLPNESFIDGDEYRDYWDVSNFIVKEHNRKLGIKNLIINPNIMNNVDNIQNMLDNSIYTSWCATIDSNAIGDKDIWFSFKI